MASKRDLLLVRLAIKWKWLTAEEGEDVLFLKRKFGNKLTIEQIIRRRGYLGWEEIDQVADAASAQTGRRAAPAKEEKKAEAKRTPPPRRRTKPGAPVRPPPDERTVAMPPPSFEPAPLEEDDADEFGDGRTQIAPLPSLMRAAEQQTELLPSAPSEAKDGGPASQETSLYPVVTEPLVGSVDLPDIPGDPTVFDQPAIVVPDSDSRDLPTVESEAHSGQPEPRQMNIPDQVTEAMATLRRMEPPSGVPSARTLIPGVTGQPQEISVETQPVPEPIVLRDEHGDEFLEGDFGPYMIRRVIARGSRSVVYAAQHKERGDEVALKVLDMAPADAARFFDERGDEILQAARLNTSQVVRILDVGVVHDRYFVALEYIDGWTLEEMIDAGDRPSFVQLAEIGHYLAGALAAAESIGIMHLDIRPDHVIVAENGDARLSGFGFAPERPGFDPSGPPIRGTLPFMAPEQALGHPESRTDLYGIGATLYYVLAGRVPFAGATDENDLLQQTISKPPVDPREIDPTIPDSLAQIVLRLLEKSAEDRFANARELYEAFEQALFDMEAAGFLDVPTGPEPPPMRPIVAKTVIASVPLAGVAVAGALGLEVAKVTGRSASEVALDGALFGALTLIAATLLFSTLALIRRGRIPLPMSSAWLVSLQEGAGALGALFLLAASVLAPPAVLNITVATIAVGVLGSGIFGTLLRRAIAKARSDGGVGRMLAVLGDPLLSQWRLVHAPLIVCLTALASARFAVMAYFASA